MTLLLDFLLTFWYCWELLQWNPTYFLKIINSKKISTYKWKISHEIRLKNDDFSYFQIGIETPLVQKKCSKNNHLWLLFFQQELIFHTHVLCISLLSRHIYLTYFLFPLSFLSSRSPSSNDRPSQDPAGWISGSSTRIRGPQKDTHIQSLGHRHKTPEENTEKARKRKIGRVSEFWLTFPLFLITLSLFPLFSHVFQCVTNFPQDIPIKNAPLCVLVRFTWRWVGSCVRRRGFQEPKPVWCNADQAYF